MSANEIAILQNTLMILAAGWFIFAWMLYHQACKINRLERENAQLCLNLSCRPAIHKCNTAPWPVRPGDLWEDSDKVLRVYHPDYVWRAADRNSDAKDIDTRRARLKRLLD